LAGVNERGQRCHGVRKAAAGDAARAKMTEAEMMKYFGWTDPKMPALYIAEANGEEIAQSGADKLHTYREQRANAAANRGVTNRPLGGKLAEKLERKQR